jgi:hypothetical protein
MKQQTEEIEDEILLIRNNIDDKEIISDELMTEIKTLKDNSIKNSIDLSRLFILCYDILKVNKNLLSKDNKLFNKTLNEIETNDKLRIHELRSLLEQYGDGKEICSHYVGQDIKIILNSERDKFIDLINFFFLIFGEDE